MDFNSIEWHDVVIDKYVIDRSNPGNEDTIQFFLSDYSGKKMKLIFWDVYQSNMRLNFAIIPAEGKETICCAHQEGSENELVQNLYKSWKGLFDDIPLNYYEIEMNSTGSKIQIVAKGFTYEILR